MRRGLIVGIAAIAVVVGGGAAFIWFSGGSGEPSTDVTAPPVQTTTTAASAGDGEAPAEASTTTTTAAESSGGPITFELTRESQASFTLQEDLRGNRTTVVGTTDRVVGQLLVDPSDPASAQLGEILINARTLSTDNDFRNRAIRGQILESSNDAFEFITFSPTTIEGLPDEAGVPFTFDVTGDLTIRDITMPVTFTVTIEEASDNSVVGTATAQVLRSDFDLTIPEVPSVANVTDEVDLELFFVAEPVS